MKQACTTIGGQKGMEMGGTRMSRLIDRGGFLSL